MDYKFRINKLEGLENVLDCYDITSYGVVISWKQVDGLCMQGCVSKKGVITAELRTKQGKYKYPSVHRLVAKAFISNPNNYNIVKHLDGNKSNNDVYNLYWSDVKGEDGAGQIKDNYIDRPIDRYDFKDICKKNGWIFEDFEETYVGCYNSASGSRGERYTYSEK